MNSLPEKLEFYILKIKRKYLKAGAGYYKYCSLGHASQLFHTVRMDHSGCPSSVTLTVIIKNFRPRNFELTFTPGHFVINCHRRQKWGEKKVTIEDMSDSSLMSQISRNSDLSKNGIFWLKVSEASIYG